jgi:membrane associated rhomboid family serine protease
MFLHANVLDLAVNMTFLAAFGPSVESRFGSLRFLGFYVLGGLVALALQVVVAPGSSVPVLGASGALAGVLGAYLVMYPRARIATVVVVPFRLMLIELTAWRVIVLWVVLDAILGAVGLSTAFGAGAGVAYYAHFGGVAFGVLVALAVGARRQPAREGVLGELDPHSWLRLGGEGLLDRGWVGLLALEVALLLPAIICAVVAVYLLVLLVTLIASGHADTSAAALWPWIIVGAFFAWVGSALVYPLGAGRYNADAYGARPATGEETHAYEHALAGLDLDPGVRRPRWLYVLDDPSLNACVIADTLIVNQGLFASRWLAPILAHELGHLNSTDPRVSVTVDRLAAPARATAPIRNWQTEQLRSGQPTGWLGGLGATILRLCAGGLATDMMRPAWSAWWRLREYAADDYAARLGQADALAGFFEADGMLYDAPIRRIWASKETHPPTALRIDRLRQHRQQHQLGAVAPAVEPAAAGARHPDAPPG